MSISVYAAGSTIANALTITYTKRTGVANGDVVLIAVVFEGNKVVTDDGTLTAVTGITNPQQTGTASTDVKMRFYYHIISGTSPASWTFTQSASGRIAVMDIVLRGADATTPIDTAAVALNTLAAPTVSPTSSAALLLYLTGYWGTGNTVSFAAPTGMTEQADITANSANGEIATEQLTAAGATGTRTATLTGTAGKNISALIAIKPSALVTSVRMWNGSAFVVAPRGRQIRGASAWIVPTA